MKFTVRIARTSSAILLQDFLHYRELAGFLDALKKAGEPFALKGNSGSGGTIKRRGVP